MARPGSEKESLVGLSSPKRWGVHCRALGIGPGRSPLLPWRGYPRGLCLARRRFSGGQPATVSGAGFVPLKPHH